jgi:hypothetical protein
MSSFDDKNLFDSGVSGVSCPRRGNIRTCATTSTVWRASLHPSCSNRVPRCISTWAFTATHPPISAEITRKSGDARRVGLPDLPNHLPKLLATFDRQTTARRPITRAGCCGPVRWAWPKSTGTRFFDENPTHHSDRGLLRSL